jgi:hypothetical protein
MGGGTIAPFGALVYVGHTNAPILCRTMRVGVSRPGGVVMARWSLGWTRQR